MILNDRVKQFIQQNMDLINANNFLEISDKLLEDMEFTYDDITRFWFIMRSANIELDFSRIIPYYSNYIELIKSDNYYLDNQDFDKIDKLVPQIDLLPHIKTNKQLAKVAYYSNLFSVNEDWVQDIVKYAGEKPLTTCSLCLDQAGIWLNPSIRYSLDDRKGGKFIPYKTRLGADYSQIIPGLCVGLNSDRLNLELKEIANKLILLAEDYK